MHSKRLCVITESINQIVCIDSYLINVSLRVIQLCPEYFFFLFSVLDLITDKKGIIFLIFGVASYLGIYIIS